MTQPHLTRATLLAIFIGALSSSLVGMKNPSGALDLVDKENERHDYENIVLSENEVSVRLQMYKNVNNALSIIREFNFRTLKKSDQRLEQLYRMLVYFLNAKAESDHQAAFYFDGCQAMTLCSYWNAKGVYFEREQDRLKSYELLLKSLKFLEKVMKSKKVVHEIRTSLESNILRMIQEIKSHVELYENAYHALKSIRIFNFTAFKRNDQKLQNLYEELVCFFNRNAKTDLLATVYFNNECAKSLIESWDNQKQCFEKNRNIRMGRKKVLFDSLEFFEGIMLTSSENDLLRLLQSTRTDMTSRLCARS